MLQGSHGFSVPTLVSPCRFDEPSCITTTSSRHGQYPVYPQQRPNMIPNSQVLQEMIYPNEAVGYQGMMPEYPPNQNLPSPVSSWMPSWHQRQNYPSFLSHPHQGEGYYGYNGDMVDYEDQDNFPQKRKRARTAFTGDQLRKLEKRFHANHYIVGEERQKIADELDLSEAQVKVWFQNRRTKFKRDQELEKLGKTKKRKGEHHIRKWQLTTRHFGPETNQLFSDQSDEEHDNSV